MTAQDYPTENDRSKQDAAAVAFEQASPVASGSGSGAAPLSGAVEAARANTTAVVSDHTTADEALENTADSLGRAAGEALEEPARRDVLHFDMTALEGERSEDAHYVDERPAYVPPAEEILFQRQFCLREKGGDCNRCALACPTEAISFNGDGWPEVDEGKCTHCGICYGICDAFISSRVNTIDLRSRIRRMTALDKVLFITCRENVFSDMDLADNVLTVPCLAALSPELLASVLASGTRVIVAGNLAYCDNCPVAYDRGEMMYLYSFELAEQWTGKRIEFVEEVPEHRDFMDRVSQEDRRDAFAGIISAVGEVASGHYRSSKDRELQEFEARREEMQANAWTAEDYDHPLNRAMRQPGKFKTLFPRRQFLIEAANEDEMTAERIQIAISQTDAAKCQGCFDCVQTCISGARGIGDDDYLTFDNRYCIGCGLCVSACGRGAVEMLEFSAAQFTQEEVLACNPELVDAARAADIAQEPPISRTAQDASDLF